MGEDNVPGILKFFPEIYLIKKCNLSPIKDMTTTKNTVTRQEVLENMKDVLVRTEVEFGKPTTYVTVRMKNGFTLRESTTCVDPANYNEAMGRDICLKRLEEKVWMLLGYELQSKLNNDTQTDEKNNITITITKPDNVRLVDGDVSFVVNDIAYTVDEEGEMFTTPIYTPAHTPIDEMTGEIVKDLKDIEVGGLYAIIDPIKKEYSLIMATEVVNCCDIEHEEYIYKGIALLKRGVTNIPNLKGWADGRFECWSLYRINEYTTEAD